MNPKQKKFLWLAGIVVAVFYFAPSILNSIRYAALIRAQNEARLARAQAAKPSAGQGASPLPASGSAPGASSPGTDTSAASSAPASFDGLLGVWQGVAPLPSRGMCNLKLELRRGLQLGTYSGFPVLVCIPVTQPVIRPGNPNQFLTQMNPAAAVLTGTVKDGGIDFHVDRIISKGASDCELTGFNVTPFGSDQIAAQWKESNCSGGQILLKRLGQ
jgi:hypothetical protein